MALVAGFLLFLFSSSSAHADSRPIGCTGSGLGILLFTDAPDVHIGDTIQYSVVVFNGTGVGPVVCDSTGIQASIVTPDGVTHPITLTRTTLSNGQSDYYENQVSYVVRAQDIRSDGTVRATASDTGVIHQNDTDSQGGGNQGVNTEVSQPCILLTVQCVGSVGENGAITYTGTVTNCGNNTLVNVSVTNYVDGQQMPVTIITNLARGQVVTFTGSWIPTNPCSPSTATFIAQGADSFTTRPRTVTSTASTTCGIAVTPGIVVTKSCPSVPVAPGQLLTFSGSVSNTGNVTLTNIVVVNNRPVANTVVFTLASLAPGSVANFTGSYNAPTNCSISDTLTATANSRCGVAVTSSATANCPILTTPQITVTAACPTTPIVQGGSVTYTGTVQNSGNITLTNVLVVSDRPNANTTVFSVATLAPGASANFSGTYTVPAGACSITTTFRGTARDICTLSSVTNSVSPTCSIATTPAIAVTLVCPTTTASAGGPITYTGNVRNSGNVTLVNVVVMNQQATPATVLTVPSLAPGASANFTASFTAPLDACSVTSVVTATGNDNCYSTSVTNTATATCALVTAPGIRVTQVCPLAQSLPGTLLTYTGSVSNSGNITLTNVIVLNNQSGITPIFTAATMAPGAVSNFTGSYITPTNCFSTSVSTATGRSVCGISVTNSASASCSILTTPQITVTALCPTGAIVPGGSLTYNGTVRNSGNITLTNVVVVSDRPVANTTVFSVATLAPGASANFIGTYTVPVGACAVTTTFRGTARDICTLISVTNSVSPTCAVTTAPAVAVTLTCPTAAANTGGPITYNGTVRNSGNVMLINVVVSNNQSSPATVLTLANLAPGAIANFTASFTAPLDSCSVSSTVTATARNDCGSEMVTNSATATCTLITAPAIRVTKLCPEQPVAPGQLLTFTGSVSNSGNITLTNIVVVNNQPVANTPVFTLASLAPGAFANFSGSYTAPTNCSVSDTLTATGRSICGVSVTNLATATCPILTTPSLTVVQVCPTKLVAPGGILTYSGTVSNSGNVMLTNIVVVNNRPASNTVIFTVTNLAPGAVRSFTGSYQVPLNCCVVSSTVRATAADACTAVIITDSSTTTCTVLTIPRIVVTKICPPTATRPGQLLEYSGTVSNAGNITLVNVTVVNSQPTNSQVFGPITLAPGESAPYYASYIVPVDFCGTDTVTARGLDACTFIEVVNSVTATCPIITTPRIAVTKNCPTEPTAKGGLFIFTGTVSNPGNVTLTNVYVVNNQPSNNTPVIGPITLAPGASTNFTGSYIAPSCCCTLTDTLTARGQDRCSGTAVVATATAICPIRTAPSITVTRVCPTTPVPVGGLFTYTGSVSNSGDVLLTNVFVVSSQPNANTAVSGPFELAPRETKAFSGSFIVTTGSDPMTGTVTARGSDSCQGRVVTAMANCSGPLGTSTISITSVTSANGIATVTWTAVSGKTYSLQRKATLQDASWTSVPGDVIATGESASKSDAVGVVPQYFYRVIQTTVE